MSHHPEATPDEIFVGNTKRVDGSLGYLQAGGMKTVRLGAIAYDLDGNELPNYYAPVIINRREADLHNDIMMTRSLGPDWRRRVYRG